MPENADAAEDLDELLDDARAETEALAGEEDTPDGTVDLLVDLLEVADETEDVLSTINLSRLLQVVRWENLADAIDPDGVEDALETRDVTRVLDVRKLIDPSDLPEVWASADTREAWRQKRELDEEIEDVTEFVDDVTDGDGEDSPGDAASAGDDGGATGTAGGVGGVVEDDDGGPDEDEEESPFSVDPETVENRVQMEVIDSVEEFREELLEAHERFREVQRSNRERFDRRRRRWSGTGTSRNPTAVSTLPAWPVGGGGATTHSTVPTETRHSTAPNFPRIYGRRFEAERGDDDD